MARGVEELSLGWANQSRGALGCQRPASRRGRHSGIPRVVGGSCPGGGFLMLCEEAFTGSSGRAGQRGFSLSEQGQADVCQPKMKPGIIAYCLWAPGDGCAHALPTHHQASRLALVAPSLGFSAGGPFWHILSEVNPPQLTSAHVCVLSLEKYGWHSSADRLLLTSRRVRLYKPPSEETKDTVYS